MDEWKKEWRPDEKYIGVCAKCSHEQLKKHMVALYVKDGSYSPVKILCHICRPCLPALLDELEVSMPE